MSFLNPKADMTFKRVFGEHPDLVISFLNALLPLTADEEIKEIEYLPTELVPENPLRKYSIVDVRCKDQMGRQFLVEMQMIWSSEFKQRVMFNASKAYVRQLDSGKDYSLLQPVYSLNLVNEIFEPELPGYYHHYKMVHVEHSEKVVEGLQLVFVELPKFTPHTLVDKKMQVLWLRFLTEISESTREIPEEFLASPELKKAMMVLEESAFTPAQLDGYDRFWNAIWAEISIQRTTRTKALAEGIEAGRKEGIEAGRREGIEAGRKEGIEAGRKEGIEAGRKEGIETGRKEGIEAGRKEGFVVGIAEGEKKKQLEIAQNLKHLGTSVEVIIRATGLLREEIEEL